jgi:membrane protease YdiL (CAAX protease family)
MWGLTLLKLVIAQGGMEELVFRGYCFATLRSGGRSHLRATVLAGLVFGLVHVVNLVGADLGAANTWVSLALSVLFGFVVSFASARVFEASGSILPWAVSHVIIDAHNLFDQSTRPDQGLVMFVVTLVSCGLQYLVARRFLNRNRSATNSIDEEFGGHQRRCGEAA